MKNYLQIFLCGRKEKIPFRIGTAARRENLLWNKGDEYKKTVIFLRTRVVGSVVLYIFGSHIAKQ